MIKETYTLEEYQAAADYISRQTSLRPTLAITLGSGMGPLADQIEAPVVIPYSHIPHFPHSTVPGHAGQLVLGKLQGRSIMALQGRAHFYEGHSMQAVTMPVRVMKLLGIEIFVVTNAAGGLNQSFSVGDLMLITDHINFPGMTGHSPLHGPNMDTFGPRFPDMVSPYDQALQALARQAAGKAGLTLREGVYVGLSGPAFETPAEVRFLRIIGGDAVGMSTVSEVTVARHCGIRVLGISGITNVAVTDPTSGAKTTHDEVLEAGKTLSARLIRLTQGILAELNVSGDVG
jgi:purine-nucleoside phosphorylase